MQVLYYPNFDPLHLDGVKQALLLYERVNVIIPSTTPAVGKLLIDRDAEHRHDIPYQGAFAEQDAVLSARDDGESIVQTILDIDVIADRRDEFLAALRQDLRDPQVRAWEQDWKDRRGVRDYWWYVEPGYLGLDPDIAEREYEIKRVEVKGLGEMMRLPLVAGMSLGLSEALWGAIDRGHALFTEDLASREFLWLRLKRGWKNLSRDRKVLQQLDIEPEFREAFGVAALGTYSLVLTVPNLIATLETKTVEDIVRRRTDADTGDALKAYRDGLANLVQSPKLWTAQTFADFEHIAYDIFRQDIRPAFEELDKRRGIGVKGVKDVITALGPEAAAEGVKSAGKLIIQSPAATIAKGLAAIGDLGFSLAARFAGGLIQRWQEQREKHERAKFMTYPLRLKAAADIKEDANLI